MNRYLPLIVTFAAWLVLPLTAHAGVTDALRAADNHQWGQARNLAEQSRQPVARDIVVWMYLMDGETRASFSELAAFAATHPGWPGLEKINRVAERKLPEDLSASQVISWFGNRQPETAEGMKRYMGALLSQRQTAQALSALKLWWPKADLTPSEQAGMIQTYGQYMGTADHARRLEYIMTKKQYAAARDLAARMGRGYQALVEARAALQEGDKGVESRLSQVPQTLLDDPGLLLSRVQYRRQNDMDDAAIQILRRVSEADQAGDPETWFKERNILARRMIEQGRYRDAYTLVSQHGLPPEGGDFAQAEFLAGWLALRFIHQPYTAFEHFEKLFNNVKTPISRARGAYWAGRASEALNRQDVALQWYQVAARYQTTFYGQQAAAHIGLPLNLIKGDKPVVSAAQEASFKADDMVQAARFLHQAGLSSERTQFLKALIADAKTPQEFSLLSDFAASLGQLDMAVKVAKEAEKQGLYLIDYAFPTITSTVKNAVGDRALVHALIRQESQFDQDAVSSAGALGLMQLMPATAKMTAKRAGLSHQASWLTGKPEHNVKLGSLYIHEMLNRYNGSLPLAIAAYNAGPGRVDQWIRQFGDPRTSRVDMMDWMESIPVYETRNYVQRVMEGYEVYRMKLARYDGSSAPLMRTALNP